MILLDDANSTASKPSSRLYESPLQAWSILPRGEPALTLQAIDSCLNEITTALSRGEFVVLLQAYEYGQLIHHLPSRNSQHPLLQAWSFKSVQKLSKIQVDALIAQKIASQEEDDQLAGITNVQTSIDEEQFKKDIGAIQEYILNGDVYQINHTFRISGQTYGSPLALYHRLRKRQPGRFGAYLQDGDQFILSQSPELFIEKSGDLIKAMPMKGTASASLHSSSDLSSDPKNQAENVMIVDLLRNDLSRIALPNTVTVPNLFEVAQHGDILQMTSTIAARIKNGVGIKEIFNAVFPCGSITGAPKKRSMEIIQELEPDNRDFYCGALGWLDPNGDLALSVPIRTVEIEQNHNTKASHFKMGVGAGVTIDSIADQEWEECRIKASFLTDLPSATSIFESILVTHGKVNLLELHLDRMQRSSCDLGIPFTRLEAKSLVHEAIFGLDQSISYRLRLDLSSEGNLQTSIGKLDSLPEEVRIFWAKDVLENPANAITHSGNILLRHKTSFRPVYDEAWQASVAKGGFDAIFTNESGYVTEGGRSSIFIKPKNSTNWLTPPLSAGVLPGVMREHILNDPTWNAHEANLTIEDVAMADKIVISNALRGPRRAHF